MARIVGIVAEFDPFHRGHHFLLDKVRERTPEAVIVTAMSGHFTQRGAPAALRPLARTEMALACGADLVLELPLPWAISSAEGFGWGGAAVLSAAGADALAFGSECADQELLSRAVFALEQGDFPRLLREQPSGIPFAAQRQRAVEALAGEEAGGVLSRPNDTLAVAYLQGARKLGWKPELLAVRRMGAAHNASESVEGIASASRIRSLLQAGEIDAAAALLPRQCSKILRREWEAGLCPASLQNAERAVLYRLRMMGEEDFLHLPDCSEGLEHRLYRSAQAARSLEEFYTLAKSKRYAHARIRRLALRAFLGMRREDRPERLPYVRLLGVNERGRGVLREMKKRVPIITKPAAALRELGEEGRQLFRLEQRGADLWRLCLPTLEKSQAGQGWKEGPVIWESKIEF